MKLDKHIALRFLTDKGMAHEIAEHMYPEIGKMIKDLKPVEEIAKHPHWNAHGTLLELVFPDAQKTYVITDTVMDKLDMLKVGKNADYNLTGKGTNDTLAVIKTYDWSVFDHISNRKVTLILPDNSLVRLRKDDKFISFIYLGCEIINWKGNDGHIKWTTSFIDYNFKRLSANWMDQQMQDIELFIYRLLCFLYLSENTEEIVQPGNRYGTRKSGKVVNGLPVPVTIVNSKWNITSIRTEGFDVSGHFRLQPTKTGTKMILIQPFRKHGYVRKAKSEEEK